LSVLGEYDAGSQSGEAEHAKGSNHRGSLVCILFHLAAEGKSRCEYAVGVIALRKIAGIESICLRSDRGQSAVYSSQLAGEVRHAVSWFL
jgi:hypothetical protein